MTVTTVRTGIDSYVDSGSAGGEFHTARLLKLNPSGPERLAFLHLANPAPAGATIQSAKLRVYARGASSGARTLTARRVTASWKARTLNYSNRPTAVGPAGTGVVVDTLADKAVIEFDVTADLTAIQGGAAHHGWRLEITGGALSLYAFDDGASPANLVVDWIMAPGKPTDLAPAGRVGVANPMFRWRYSGSAAMAAYELEANATNDFTAPTYDTGEVSSSDPQHLPTTLSLADAASVWWRVRVKDTAGQWSSWSDAKQVTRDDKGVVTVNNPGVAGTVEEPTPPILWGFTGETQRAYQILVTVQGDPAQVLHDSGIRTGVVTSYTLPELADDGTRLLVTGGLYTVWVRIYDTKTDRVGSAAVGDQVWAEASRNFTMTTVGTVTAPAALTAAQEGSTPLVVLDWTRSSAPDSYVILRDEKEIASGLLPGDLLVSGTAYRWRDVSPIPGVQHTYTVRAVVAGQQSPGSSSAQLPVGGVKVEGLWILDPETLRYFVVAGTGVGAWEHVEVGENFLPFGSRSPFRVTSALGGLAGTFDGFMRERTFRSVAAMEADLWLMKEAAPARKMRLVADQLNIEIQLYNVTCVTHEESYGAEGYPRRSVRFAFYQTGNFPFRAVV